MNAHRGVFEHGDAPREVGNHLGRQLALLGYRRGQLARVLLDVLDVGLELGAKLLKVLHDGALDCFGEVGVRIGDQASLLALFAAPRSVKARRQGGNGKAHARLRRRCPGHHLLRETGYPRGRELE